MLNYLTKSTREYGDKTQWASGESHWLVRVLSDNRLIGVFLKHHRQDAEVHLCVSRLTKSPLEKPWSFPIWRLAVDRSEWQLLDTIHADYLTFLKKNAITLGRIDTIIKEQ